MVTKIDPVESATPQIQLRVGLTRTEASDAGEELLSIFHQANTDNDDVISQAEYDSYIAASQKADEADKTEEAHKTEEADKVDEAGAPGGRRTLALLDTNGDGKISPEESAKADKIEERQKEALKKAVRNYTYNSGQAKVIGMGAGAVAGAGAVIVIGAPVTIPLIVGALLVGTATGMASGYGAKKTAEALSSRENKVLEIYDQEMGDLKSHPYAQYLRTKFVSDFENEKKKYN